MRRAELARARTQERTGGGASLQLVRIATVETSAPTIIAPDREPHDRPSSSDAIHRSLHVTVSLSSAAAARLIAVITAPVGSGETYREAGMRKEAEVAALLVQLDAQDAYQLERLLRLDRRDEPVAAAFRGLVADRRQRLRALLERHRRTVAVQGARSATR